MFVAVSFVFLVVLFYHLDIVLRLLLFLLFEKLVFLGKAAFEVNNCWKEVDEEKAKDGSVQIYQLP